MRNGSGTWVNTPGTPVVPGTVISSTMFNNFVSDVGGEITNSLPRDGQAPMTGVLKLIDGSVGSPGLSFNSESTTGIFRPGTGQLALVAGGVLALTAASGAINFNGDANIGTGLLRVGVTTGTPQGSSIKALIANGGGIQLDSGSGGGGGAIVPISGGGLILHRYTGAIGAETYTESVRITSSGNVGIGTNSPGKPLDVVGDTANGVAVRVRGRSADNIGNLEFTSNDGLTSYGVLQGRAGSELRLVSNGATFISAYTNGLERFRIDSGGRVGIGFAPLTTTGGNGNTLQVGDPSSVGGTGITIGSSAACDIQFSRATTGANQYAGLIRYSQTSDYMALWTASAERVRIDSSGNLSVGGVPNNNYKIHAQGTGSTQVASQGTTDASFITNVNGTQSLYLHSTATMSEVNELRALPLLFTVNGAERARIDSSGNFGIGGAPTTKLDVNSSGASDLMSSVRNTGTTGAAIQSLSSGNGTTSSKYSYLRFYNNATAPRDWRVGTYGNDNFTIRDETAASNRLVIDTNGNVGINMATTMTYKLEVGASGVIALNDSTNTNKGTLQMTAGGLELYATGSKYIAFGSNSIERLRLDSSGNLGVNGTPSAWHASARAVQMGTGGALWNYSTSQLNLSQGMYYDAAGYKYLNTGVASANLSLNTGGLYFSQYPSGTAGAAGTGSTTFSIDASGNTNIGGGSSTYKLGVVGPVELQPATGQGLVSNFVNPLIYATEATGSFAFNGHLVLQPRGSAAGAVIVATGSGAGAMTERLRVDATGNVLRGATSAIFGGDQTGFINSNGTQVGYWGTSSTYGGTFIGTYSNHSLGLMTNNTTRLLIDSSGNVGIGTSPASTALLHLKSSSSALLRIESGGTANSTVAYYPGGATNPWYTYVDPNRNYICQDNATERLRIDANGNIGVGITPSAWDTFSTIRAIELNAAGNALSTSTDQIFVSQNAYNTATGFKRGKAAQASLYQQSSGDHAFYGVSSGAANSTITWKTNLRITLGGEVLAQGNGGIGYGGGSGGTVTQLTSKSTGVTLNKVSGQITTSNSALANGVVTGFTLTNSTIGANDIVLVQRTSGGSGIYYRVWVDSVAAGSCFIAIKNDGGPTLSESLVLSFAVIRVATA